MLNPRQNTSKLQHRAREMRKTPSDAERKLWYELRDRRLEGLKFRRQMPIGNSIADFACEAKKLIVEVDGQQHDSPEAIAYDEQRTTWLNDQGWTVVRFSAFEVLRETKGVLRAIMAAAEKSGPSPGMAGRG